MTRRTFLAALFFLPASALARDRSARRAFHRSNPCPSTGRTSGACPGYVVDHVVPLCAGGADEIGNMQWQERQAAAQKDGRERRECAATARP